MAVKVVKLIERGIAARVANLLSLSKDKSSNKLKTACNKVGNPAISKIKKLPVTVAF